MTFIYGVKDGEDVNGFTVSWLMQALPTVRNCVKQDSRSHERLKEVGCFISAFLEAEQKNVAQKSFNRSIVLVLSWAMWNFI